MQKGKWIQALYRFVFSRCSVICLSEKLAEDLHGVCKKENILICANGIEELTSELISLNTKQPIKLLFFSNLIVTKGINMYLEMCRQLDQKMCPLKQLLPVSFQLILPLSI